ncbi:Aste57867_15886 [Aphanomyces stellatus]|uniref:Aste57867_15886 protein n=1 Tax=Aphanomyces stellatus TaxID=120398 RepID=A0A485L4H0_9STRA|nr:hypothetical protein As57867_015830 [Aphanomyces stellatus]VFT92673.1 Aste57867_15886 [Aphanomyces stellatus]
MTPPDELLQDLSLQANDTDSVHNASSEASSHQGTKPKKVNAFRKRQREELTYLRTKVDELESQLSNLHRKHAKFEAETSPWKIIATQLREEKNRALADNEAWRGALQDQILFGNALHALLKQRPRLSMIPTLGEAQWKLLHLSQDPMERHETALAIVQHQYSLLPSVLVASGLMDKHTDFTSCVPKTWEDDNLLVVESAAVRRYDCDFQLWGQMAWMVLSGGFASMDVKLLEMFSDDMIYLESPCRILNLDGQCRDVVKRFVEPSREIIVFRSILHDDAMPLAKDFIANEAAWMLIEPAVPHGCSVKFFNKSTPPTLQPGVASPDAAVVEKVIDGLVLRGSSTMMEFEGAMRQLL